MPKRRLKERAIIAQLVIDLVKTIHEGRMPHDSLSGDVEAMLISGQVLIGQASGRPRSAAAIGRSLKIPRATVQRKLARLHDAGMVKENGVAGTWAITEAPRGEYINKSMALIVNAAAKITLITSEK